jgi:hypothetical protein
LGQKPFGYKILKIKDIKIPIKAIKIGRATPF